MRRVRGSAGWQPAAHARSSARACVPGCMCAKSAWAHVSTHAARESLIKSIKSETSVRRALAPPTTPTPRARARPSTLPSLKPSPASNPPIPPPHPLGQAPPGPADRGRQPVSQGARPHHPRALPPGPPPRRGRRPQPPAARRVRGHRQGAARAAGREGGVKRGALVRHGGGLGGARGGGGRGGGGGGWGGGGVSACGGRAAGGVRVLPGEGAGKLAGVQIEGGDRRDARGRSWVGACQLLPAEATPPALKNLVGLHCIAFEV
jgi:uncharacterized membrane protein YgcG